ncbi:SWIM zinc finger domain-containing protein [Streptomyces macrosporus]|uniref:SWIM zinc finger domain-containing protein n=1 Tax=Streptomyces macrosporus TaxID=44032 RepID=A0ABP5WHL4_9ACTN
MQTYVYLRPSAVRRGAGGSELALETSGGATPSGAGGHPRFFSGFVTAPEAAAAALLSVADVASTRYHRRLSPASLDPVVTGSGDRLRFESFSGCCGVHARLDVLAEGLDGDDIGRGTTNVDVNAPLREALVRVGPGDPLHLRIGPEELEVTTLDGPVVEKRVPLPDRWLRGFAETQVIASAFDLRAEVTAAEAVRFLRSLSRVRSGAGAALWVVPAGRGLRPTVRPVPGAVCLPGPDRLAALLRVLRHARGLRLYGPPVTAASAPTASAWEVTLPGMRLTLTLSPDPARGFSGEGAVLDALAAEDAAEDAERVSVLPAWEPRVDVVDLARRAGLTPERVRAALAVLGASGRIGYDTAEAAHFHRELPFDAGRAERHNPRLRAARALVEAGAVRAEADGTFTVVSGGEGAVHRVRVGDGGAPSCTCRWWGRYRGDRGPCRHALAVRIVRGAAASPATVRGGAR